MTTTELELESIRTALNGSTALARPSRRLHDGSTALEHIRTALDDVETATATALDDGSTVHGSTVHLAFYVPSTGKDGSIVSQSEFTKRTEQIALLFCRLFRGCTVYPTLGYWVDDDGRMIHERINIVKTATDPALLLGHSRTVHDVATTNGRLWYQQTIMLDVNQQTIMIDI